MVRDEADGAAAVAQSAQLGEQLRDLLGREHRSRLVEDQYAHITMEELADLHLLTGRNREITDDRVGVEGEAERVDAGLYANPRSGAVDAAEAPQPPDHWLDTEHDVLPHHKFAYEKDFLVDHADAVVHGLTGRAVAHRPAPHHERSRVGLDLTAQDLHERALAGTVLPHERVDRAAPHGCAHPIQRDDVGRVHLGDRVEPEAVDAILRGADGGRGQPLLIPCSARP